MKKLVKQSGKVRGIGGTYVDAERFIVCPHCGSTWLRSIVESDEFKICEPCLKSLPPRWVVLHGEINWKDRKLWIGISILTALIVTDIYFA